MRASIRIREKGGRRFLWAAAVTLGVVTALAFGVPQAAGAASRVTAGGARLDLVPGNDSTPLCSSYPCATVSSPSGGDATVSFSLGISSSEPRQPETYYTDLLRLVNPTPQSVTITSVTLGGLTETRQGDIGGITVYLCAHQTNDPGTGCEGSFTASGTSGGSVFRGEDVVPAGGASYIELAGFAGVASHVGDTMGFTLEVTAE